MSSRLLVLNSESILLRLVEQLLKSEGYKDVVGLVGPYCLDDVMTIDPDLILFLDVSVDRTEESTCFLQRLKCNPTMGHEPIILRRDLPGQELALKEALGATGVYVLPEPFTIADLVHTVQAALEARDRLPDGP